MDTPNIFPDYQSGAIILSTFTSWGDHEVELILDIDPAENCQDIMEEWNECGELDFDKLWHEEQRPFALGQEMYMVLNGLCPGDSILLHIGHPSYHRGGGEYQEWDSEFQPPFIIAKLQTVTDKAERIRLTLEEFASDFKL